MLLFILGILVMVIGVILSFLMVLKLIPTTFFLVFFTYGSTVTGIAMGFAGFALYLRSRN